MLHTRGVVCAIDYRHSLLDTLLGLFAPPVSFFLWPTGFRMCLFGGITSVAVWASERARVGLGHSDAFALVHVQVILTLEKFGPPLLDRLFGPALATSEHAFVMKHNYHMPAWLAMRVVVRTTFGFLQIHFEGRTFGLRHILHSVDVTTSGQNLVARAFRDLHLHKGPKIV